MRIDRLDLIAYGSFTDKSLDLSEGSSGLHLIYGDNEAGKSTSLRALIALLFGIPARTSDNYLHANPQMRIGGKLRLSGGEEIKFVRRKGTKGTLLEPGTNTAMDDSVLMPFLPGGIDENLFRKLYGIDHAGLISGGKELLSQSGDLGQALFSAAVGTADFRRTLSELQEGAENLFKPRASKKLLNQEISSYKEAKRRIRDSSLPVAEWKTLNKKLDDILFDIQKVEEEIAGKRKEKNHLERLNRVKGALAERRNLLAKVTQLGEVLLLAEDFDEKRKTADNNLRNAEEAKERADTKLIQLNKEVNTLNIRNELLENEEVILSIHKELGAVETAIKDRPRQDGKRRQLRNEAEQLLKSIRPDLNIDDAHRLRPLTNNKKWISGLVQKHSLLNQKKEKAEATLRDIKDEQEKIRKELDEPGESTLDLGELKAAVAAARKAGDIEQRLADLGKRASDEKSACADELLRIGRFPKSVSELATVAMPVPETLDMFEKEFDELSNKTRDHERRQREITEELKQAEQDLETLLSTGDVPTISDLEKSRSIRNTGWHLIKQKYIKGVDVEKDIQAFVPDSDLTLFYEKRIDDADHLSDRLRLSADQVVKRADLETRINDLNSRHEQIMKEIRLTDKAGELLQAKWHSVWSPAGVEAGTPREMKQWLLKVDNLLSDVKAVKIISTQAEKLVEDCKSIRTSISRQIEKFDDSIDLSGMNLDTLLNLCEQRIEKEEKALTRKNQLEHSLSDAEIRIKRTCEELASIENDRNTWTLEWGRAIDGLGLKPDVHPEQATAVFDQLLDYFEKFDKSEELRKRIYGIDQVIKKFDQKVFTFSDTIGFERDNKDAGIIAARLNRDLNAAREARASLKKIEIQKKEKEEEIEDAEITIRTARQQLTLLMEQAGVDTEDELEQAGERSRQRRELQKKNDMLEQELIRTGDGLSITELEQEASDADIDAIEGELERVSLELKELQEKRDTLRDQRKTLQNEINARDGSGKAAKAAEEAEQHVATIVSGVEQYLRLKIAALILEERIEAYRKENQAPVLSRAGEIFSRLTLGSYIHLRDELDKNGRPVLLGVLPNDIEVSIDGMSDGTRDQLFLSLRLATLEHHLGKAEPMPLVVDDILIGFDDRRTRVCLEILGELALSTQILLFTHHRRVMEIAGKIDAKAGIYEHTLH